MTCIIGYLDRISHIGYIAGDSTRCSIDVGYQDLVSGAKVFRAMANPKILIGATTSFRHIDLLKYEDIFEGLRDPGDLTHAFMVKTVVPRIHDLFCNCWTEESIENGANVVIVTPHDIYEIQSDYSVICPITNYIAVGSGKPYAMASLYTSDAHPRMHPRTTSDFFTDQPDNRPKWIKEDLSIAMNCAERYGLGVHNPFLMLSTEGEADVLE